MESNRRKLSEEELDLWDKLEFEEGLLLEAYKQNMFKAKAASQAPSKKASDNKSDTSEEPGSTKKT